MPTTIDPLEQAREQLDDAFRSEADAQARLEEFKTRILAGDTDVSADDYAAAGQAAEFAQLRVEAAKQAVQAAERAARLDRLEALKAEIGIETGSPDEALADYLALVEVAERIIARCHARRRNVDRWQAELAREGVPKSSHDAAPDPEHAGLSWARADMGLSDAVLVDGRRIGYLSHEPIIGAAIRQAAIKAGISGHQDVFDNPALRNDPERWFRNNY